MQDEGLTDVERIGVERRRTPEPQRVSGTRQGGADLSDALTPQLAEQEGRGQPRTVVAEDDELDVCLLAHEPCDDGVCPFASGQPRVEPAGAARGRRDVEHDSQPTSVGRHRLRGGVQ